MDDITPIRKIDDLMIMEQITAEMYSSLGLGPGMFDQSSATGIQARETYRRLFGKYPEEEQTKIKKAPE